MALQNFVDGLLPTIKAAFLNQIDAFVNTLFSGATTSAQARTALGLSPFGNPSFGQCRLIKSGANLSLVPYQGNQLFVNGTWATVPASGVALAATSLTPGQLYYIYATQSGGTVNAISPNGNAHVTDPTNGNETLSGDPTQVLVGMARPIAGPAWVDTTSQRFVSSWFNRKPLLLRTVLGANQGNAGTSYSVLLSTLLLEFLVWSGDSISGKFQGGLTNNVANAVTETSIFVDASAAESFSLTGAYTGAAVQPVYCSIDAGPDTLTEGYHNLQIYSAQSPSSTATYQGSGTAATRCVHSAIVLG